MNHLTSITNRQRNSRIRDAVFAAFVALGAIVSVTTLSTVSPPEAMGSISTGITGDQGTRGPVLWSSMSALTGSCKLLGWSQLEIRE